MKSNLEKLKNVKASPLTNLLPVKTFYFDDKIKFPCVVESNIQGANLTNWYKSNEEYCKEVVLNNGGILFRGFNIETLDEFSTFIKELDFKPLKYSNRTSPRNQVAENVYTSTNQPNSEVINFHSENSYSINPPRHLIFCCIIEPNEGGETPLACNREILSKLPNDLKEKFRRLGIKYRRNVNNSLGLGWKEIFQVETRQEVENECVKNNITFQWIEDNLILEWNSPAICQHPSNGDDVWFNHGYFFNEFSYSSDFLKIIESEEDFPFLTFFGDGSVISKNEYMLIHQAYETSKIEFKWKKGDVLIIDNYLLSHARNPYQGERRIIVSIF